MKSPQMSLLADTPASHSPKPGSDEARRMTAISGQKCIDLLKPSGLDGSLPRTLLGISVWASTVCYLTWKPRTTDGGRLLFQLVPLTQSTDETEFGLWRTPTAEDCMDREFARNSRGEPKLSAQAKHGKDALWPTPRANKLRGKDRDDFSPSLHNAVKMWPTPQAADNRDRGNLSSGAVIRRAAKGKQIMLSQSVSHESGQLNPQWVEWLMGYPVGWTDLDHSGTQSSLKSPKSSDAQ
jgi:hypothetical protein